MDFEDHNFSDMFSSNRIPEEEGILRAQQLQVEIIQIATVAALKEAEYLRNQNPSSFRGVLEQLTNGDYAPKTLNSILSSIYGAIFNAFGDIPAEFYPQFVDQIAEDVIGFFIETYVYCLKTALTKTIRQRTKATIHSRRRPRWR